jgi:hypothetical protein
MCGSTTDFTAITKSLKKEMNNVQVTPCSVFKETVKYLYQLWNKYTTDIMLEQMWETLSMEGEG